MLRRNVDAADGAVLYLWSREGANAAGGDEILRGERRRRGVD